MINIDTSQFNAMCSRLGELVPSVPVKTIVKTEASRVLARAARTVPVAKAGKIREAHNLAEYVTMNGKIYRLANEYSNAMWSELLTARKRSLTAKLGARGLARQSWWLASKEMGEPFAVSGFVKNAMPSTGRTYSSNIRVAVQESRNGIGIEVTNAQPTINLLPNSVRDLQNAITFRAKYFEINAVRGVFKDISRIASKYPGFFSRT